MWNIPIVLILFIYVILYIVRTIDFSKGPDKIEEENQI